MIWQFLDSRTVGGIERHVEILTRHLIARGSDAHVILLAAYADQPSMTLFRDAGLPVTRLDGSLRTLIRAIREERPALIHAHGYRANILARCAGLMTRVPVVTSFHAGLREPFPVGLYQRLDEWSGLLAGRIAVSEDIRTRLPFRAVLVENFIDVPEHTPAPPGPRIVFAGRLTPEKGPDLFCALARAAYGGDWHMFGDGPMGARLEAENARDITFHGFTSDPETIWRDAGLLVMPSRAEGLPMAALEALARGVPVLAARVGGLPRVAVPGVSGWLFPAEDLESALAALCEWQQMDAPARVALSRSAWAHARAHFSADAGLAKLVQIYARAAGRDVLAKPASRIISPAR